MRIAVATTFPPKYPTAAAMLKSFNEYWPAEIDLFVDLDPMPEESFVKTQEEFGAFMPARNVFINATWSDAKKKFYEEHQDSGDNYRFHVCRFGHKVFTLYNVAKQASEYDYLIWLDADVVTKKQITMSDVTSWLPRDGDVVSYLGRTVAPHSECGFVAYNMRAIDIIEKMHAYYTTNDVLMLPGWTDCDVFDVVVKDSPKRNLYASGGDGWNVWPHTKLGEFMEHFKGARKHGVAKNKVVHGDDLVVKTKNCLPNEEIIANIRENLTLIKQWVDYCKPHEESVVIASAGESLNYTDIKTWYDKGVKIVTVKHAIDRLKQWGIKPWACVLLDPRQHVEGFVKSPDRDVVYFVASMVAPAVVRSLIDNGCKVIGYHALVGAGEQDMLAKEVGGNAMLVSGGSATATRSIGLLAEVLGFKDIHCYGYDLCYFDKPDMEQKLPDGTPKYLEVTLAATGWGGKAYKRLFWTEGQFLAQAQEMRDLYKLQKDFKIAVYGPGMAAWWHDHYKQQMAWVEQFNAKIAERKSHGHELNEWVATA